MVWWFPRSILVAGGAGPVIPFCRNGGIIIPKKQTSGCFPHHDVWSAGSVGATGGLLVQAIFIGLSRTIPIHETDRAISIAFAG